MLKIFFPRISIGLILLTFYSCKNDGVDINATSNICPGITGPEAVYWDVRNSIPRGDLPGGVPVIKELGGQYTHPGFPLLGFTYPPGWVPETLSDPSGTTVGVNLLRQDNQAIYRWVSYQAQGFVSVEDVLTVEINNMLSFFGNQGTLTVECRNEATDNSLGNIIRSAASRFIRFETRSAMVNVNLTYVDGLPTTFISVQITAGPTLEHNDLIVDTFLPIDWQMLINPDDSSVNKDTDGDGVYDVNDRFPLDPNKW